MTKLLLIKLIYSIGVYISSKIKSLLNLKFFSFFGYWQVQMSLIIISLLWTELAYLKYKIFVCIFYLLIYLYYQFLLWLKSRYKSKLIYCLKKIKTLNWFLISFYKMTHVYIIYLYLLYIYYNVCKLFMTFFMFFFKEKNCKIIIDIVTVVFMFIQAIFLIIIDLLFSLKEKLIKSTLDEILKWRLRSMFLSLCIIHLLVIYLGYIFYYLIIYILCIKILWKFIELLFNKFLHAYDHPLRFGSFFYLPADCGFVLIHRFNSSKIFLELLQEKKYRLDYEESSGLQIKYMFIDSQFYNGKYIENIYWYRPNYVYKNMYKVGLDMVTLMNFTFFLNTIIYNCMYWRHMLRIVGSKSRGEVNNIFKISFCKKDNSFNHPKFDNKYFEDDWDDYDSYVNLNKKDIIEILDNWLELLSLCKDILYFLNIEGKNIYELNFNINVDYFQDYGTCTISERIEIFIDISYKCLIKQKELNISFKKKVINLQMKLSILEDKVRFLNLYWVYLKSFYVYMWPDLYDQFSFSHEKFLSLDLNTLKSENLGLYERELLFLGLKNLKVKKNKEIVFF